MESHVFVTNGIIFNVLFLWSLLTAPVLMAITVSSKLCGTVVVALHNLSTSAEFLISLGLVLMLQVAQLSQRLCDSELLRFAKIAKWNFLSHPFGGLGKHRCFMCMSLEEALSTSYR